MKVSTNFSSAVKALLFTSVLKIGSLLKVSFIFGSYLSFFTAAPMIAPLAGNVAGVHGALFFFAASLLLKLVLGSSLGFAQLAVVGLPSLVASLAWTPFRRITSFVVPVASAVLYLAHPQAAVCYAALWLIPLAFSLRATCSVFATAFSSTLIAHAVGSVIWIYTVPMTHAGWVALTPIALAERVIFAAGMSVLYYAVQCVRNYAGNKISDVATTTN